MEEPPTPWSIRTLRVDQAEAIAAVLRKSGVSVTVRTEERHDHGLLMKTTTWTVLHFDSEWVVALVTVARQAENYRITASKILERVLEHGPDAIEAVWRLNGRSGLLNTIRASDRAWPGA